MEITRIESPLWQLPSLVVGSYPFHYIKTVTDVPLATCYYVRRDTDYIKTVGERFRKEIQEQRHYFGCNSTGANVWAISSRSIARIYI